ncbi:MAG: mevalonate kinase [Motiliproteus sp.]|jgi:mevalonate kinase
MAHNVEIRSSAPGTLMLLGEHAVLHGSRALVLAVNKRIRVRLSPQSVRRVRIESALGRYESSLDQLDPDPRFSFVLAAIGRFQARVPTGFSLNIESDFSHQVGLGSSAAVTVAVLAVLNYWLEQHSDTQLLFEQSRQTMLEVQGRGSGADLAAAIEGGLVAYHQDGERTRFAQAPEIGLYYCGYKVKTPVVLQRVAEASTHMPQLFAELYRLMRLSVEQACEAAQQGDWPQLGRLMNLYQGLMDALGVNDARLSEMVYALRESERVLGAKISGSGLGDCVISLGRPASIPGFEAIPVQVSQQGVEVGYV